MITTKTPYRVSLFGGSTDYRSYYSRNGSLLLGFAINQSCYVTVKRLPSFADINYQVFYSKAERVKEIKDIQNPGVRGTLYFLREYLGSEERLKKIAIYIQNDLPGQTGVGTSSSMIVGLLKAFYTHLGEITTPRQLAIDAIYIERELLAEAGGVQDQIFAAYGGINSIEIDTTGYFNVRPLPVSEDFLNEFKQSSILFYTNMPRDSFQVAKSHDTIAADVQKDKILETAKAAEIAFVSENVRTIGQLLDDSWRAKRQISSWISNPQIDEMYTKIMSLGAYGCKLLGTGNGGFLFCLCSTRDRANIIQQVGLPVVDYDFSLTGSKVIFQE